MTTVPDYAHEVAAAETVPPIKAAGLALARRQTLADCAFLVLVVFISVLPYIAHVGFYIDDWPFLRLLETAPDPSLLGRMQALYAGDVVIRQRPTQVVDLAILYSLFQRQPAGYQWANAAVLAVNTILVYVVLRQLNQARVVALAAAVTYSLLPHYSTDRFWVAAFQAPLSILFYLLSLSADLKSVRALPATPWLWRGLSALAVLPSGMAYEVALPLFLLDPLFVALAARRLRAAESNRQGAITRWIRFWALPLLALLAVVLYKLTVTVRLNAPGDWAYWLALAVGTLRVSYGTYGLGLPLVLAWIFRQPPAWPNLLVSGAIGLLVWAYLMWTARKSAAEWPRPAAWLTLAGIGVLVFGGGYAIFVFNTDVWLTSASVGNRTAIAAALGVALSFVGGFGWVSHALPSSRLRWPVWCGLVAFLAASGTLIISTLGGFWGDAYDRELGLLHAIRSRWPTLPAGTTLVLDGVCLEQGGAYVFTGHRDIGPALQSLYDDDSLWATAVTHAPQITEEGLTLLTHTDYTTYPYSARLLVYQASQQQVYSLNDRAAAEAWQAASGFLPEADCPPGFAWGRNE
jgi:hypothetical protein